mmetsp:Transcript_17301/g.24984  ORF Transcript_17301/g.24984 Transcript_17301/m.24984 type:complete len:90 (+) Transcript_17301:286-555(+)
MRQLIYPYQHKHTLSRNFKVDWRQKMQRVASETTTASNQANIIASAKRPRKPTIPDQSSTGCAPNEPGIRGHPASLSSVLSGPHVEYIA